jgi:hypothetical protein
MSPFSQPDEELDFVINYDGKYRMGQDNENNVGWPGQAGIAFLLNQINHGERYARSLTK